MAVALLVMALGRRSGDGGSGRSRCAIATGK
jgi:hypothetical protein